MEKTNYIQVKAKLLWKYVIEAAINDTKQSSPHLKIKKDIDLIKIDFFERYTKQYRLVEDMFLTFENLHDKGNISKTKTGHIILDRHKICSLAAYSILKANVFNRPSGIKSMYPNHKLRVWLANELLALEVFNRVLKMYLDKWNKLNYVEGINLPTVNYPKLHNVGYYENVVQQHQAPYEIQLLKCFHFDLINDSFSILALANIAFLFEYHEIIS